MYTYNGNISKHLRELIEDCAQKCKAINIPISDNIDFFLMKGERTYGECISSPYSNYHVIKISEYLVKDEDIINTIFHELLHSCSNCKGHDWRWQQYGNLVERHYGYVIKRCGKQEVSIDIKSSRRKYYTRDEYLSNKDLLIALGTEGGDKPIWYVKKNSAIVKRVEKGLCKTSRTKQKVIIFKEEV